MEEEAAVCVMTSAGARRACAGAADGLAVFPGCLFPAEAMAGVKARLIYAGKPHIWCPSDEPAGPLRATAARFGREPGVAARLAGSAAVAADAPAREAFSGGSHSRHQAQ